MYMAMFFFQIFLIQREIMHRFIFNISFQRFQFRLIVQSYCAPWYKWFYCYYHYYCYLLD